MIAEDPASIRAPGGTGATSSRHTRLANTGGRPAPYSPAGLAIATRRAPATDRRRQPIRSVGRCAPFPKARPTFHRGEKPAAVSASSIGCARAMPAPECLRGADALGERVEATRGEGWVLMRLSKGEDRALPICRPSGSRPVAGCAAVAWLARWSAWRPAIDRARGRVSSLGQPWMINFA